MTQRANDISLIKAGIQSRAEILISLREDLSVMSELESLLVNCLDTLHKGGKIILCGNGGFAALAQHTASELVGKLHTKRSPIPAIALGTDLSVLTCIANDFGFERIFSRQLESTGDKDDVLIALSTSGKSKNILQVLSQAKEQNIKSFSFVGKSCGELCRELGSTVIEMPTNETEAVQDLTMILLHQICGCLEADWNKRNSSKSNFWEQIINVGKEKGATTLILDRDGVVNHLLPNEYVLDEASLSLNEDFLNAAKSLSNTFEHILIVSNQACIGKGYVSSETIERINLSILQSIKKFGGRVDSVYVCPDANSNSLIRKPNIGISEKILADFPTVDFHKTIVVGDSYSDELFAQRLGSMYFNLKNI